MSCSPSSLVPYGNILAASVPPSSQQASPPSQSGWPATASSAGSGKIRCRYQTEYLTLAVYQPSQKTEALPPYLEKGQPVFFLFCLSERNIVIHRDIRRQSTPLGWLWLRSTLTGSRLLETAIISTNRIATTLTGTQHLHLLSNDIG